MTLSRQRFNFFSTVPVQLLIAIWRTRRRGGTTFARPGGVAASIRTGFPETGFPRSITSRCSVRSFQMLGNMRPGFGGHYHLNGSAILAVIASLLGLIERPTSRVHKLPARAARRPLGGFLDFLADFADGITSHGCTVAPRPSSFRRQRTGLPHRTRFPVSRDRRSWDPIAWRRGHGFTASGRRGRFTTRTWRWRPHLGFQGGNRHSFHGCRVGLQHMYHTAGGIVRGQRRGLGSAILSRPIRGERLAIQILGLIE